MAIESVVAARITAAIGLLRTGWLSSIAAIIAGLSSG
ncbi:hypothetical protein HDC29_003102 [Sphingopyxis sp. JAI108]|nr:hypothetical protein [Sphingopyxis sp. JAI108]